MMNYDLIVIGGGAAGFFTAINYAMRQPDHRVLILEKNSKTLSKLKVSGGGRCNVTHACFEPRELVKFYPRGNKALRSVFHQFQPGDTIAWFDERGIALKIEEDNRMFPETDDSQTIIDCFLAEAQQYNVKVYTQTGVQSITQDPDTKKWLVKTESSNFQSTALMMASGSSQQVWGLLEQLGHRIEKPVPSLFTFRIKDARLEGLSGISVENTEIWVEKTNLNECGPLLITHKGLSAPAILKISAWGARQLHDMNYQFQLKVNWLADFNPEEMKEELIRLKETHPKKTVLNTKAFDLPKRLWEQLCAHAIDTKKNWADLNKKEIHKLAEELCACRFQVNGKNTFKDEFVTCGGIDLNEVDFKNMESKLFPKLYFAGEVLDIDALTGGFNFQAAWSTSWIAAQHI